jgi:L-fuconolactonase
MWASDWPPLDLASDYGTWAAICAELLAHLSAQERAAIFAGTARRVYRLS